ncbi:hypothetical protein OYC64_020312 [Pagothenia borchgrevinki]|uniref:Uncharacterized protein n=1 Tax=Pagothenia borchgrevinki TaxID=8213 RepID=A0ABD2FLA5_PAGBO
MITQAIQSLINWSIHNCAGDNIWEYNKARLWSHLLLEDTGAPVRGKKGGQNLRDFASNTAERKRGIRTKLHPRTDLKPAETTDRHQG